MKGSLWVTATDLESWADRMDARGILPLLVRRLILATTPGLSRCDMRAAEGGQLPGWGGVVHGSGATAFVPAGASVWEMGTNEDPQDKANRDYRKRTKDPQDISPRETNFVFVSPRRWKEKAAWETARSKEGDWLRVRALDADDLQAWLEIAPSVHLWISTRLGRRPNGTTDMASWFDIWLEATTPNLVPELLILGRQDAVNETDAWLESGTATLSIRSDSREESLAFFAAALRIRRDLPAERLESRSAVVENQDGWEELCFSTQPLILVPLFDSSAEHVTLATRNGHRVVIPRGASDPTSLGEIRPDRISRNSQRILRSMKVAEDEISTLSKLAHRSLLAFRRRIAASPSHRTPGWAQPSEGPSLVPALIAGMWNETYLGDREALGALAGGSYELLREKLPRWSALQDPPLRSSEGLKYLAAPDDAWSLLSRFLGKTDLDRLTDVADRAFSAWDPRFAETDPDPALARALGRHPQFSSALLRGISESATIMGCSEGSLHHPGVDLEEAARALVRRILRAASADWKSLATVAPCLPDLAEAAPDVFLDWLEGSVKDRAESLARLFMDKERGWHFTSPHTHLLWALERLAWSRDHLSRVVQLLSKLASIDPGGRTSNRPGQLAAQILCLESPQTSCDGVTRIEVVRGLVRQDPAAGWTLASELLFERGGHPFGTSRPVRRDWHRLDTPIPPEDNETSRTLLLEIVLEGARTSGARLHSILSSLLKLSPAQRERVVTVLEAVDVKGLQEGDLQEVRSGIRAVLSWSSSAQGQSWSLTKEMKERLEATLLKLEPANPVVPQAAPLAIRAG